MKRRIYFALTVLSIALIIFATTANANEGFQIQIIDKDNYMYISTEAKTVFELLQEQQIELGYLDIVSPRLDTTIFDNMVIEINRAFEVYISINGSEAYSQKVSPNTTIFGLTQILRTQSGQNYLANKPSSMILYPEATIELQTISMTHQISVLPIKYERIYEYSDSLEKDNFKLIQKGIEGSHQIKDFVQYIGEQEVFRNTISDQILEHPTNQVILIGTAQPTNTAVTASGQTFNYREFRIMEATAYTADFYSTGRHPGDPWFGITASGMQAQVGVVAVDTDVIPFNTRLYIEGYGFAIAGDRGSAIRGNKIDLFFDTRAEALEFGRQHIRVWILE